ncbi:MAG: discoidin domain-containing protein, partial [Phycisphaerae bacterium]
MMRRRTFMQWITIQSALAYATVRGTARGHKSDADSESKVTVAHLWSDKPLARTGDTITFSAFIENSGHREAKNVLVVLKVPGAAVSDPQRNIPVIAAGSYKRLDWSIKAGQPGPMLLTVAGPALADQVSYKILVIERDAQYTRQELCTDAVGYWRLLAKPSALQLGNPAPPLPIKHLRSSEIKHNTYGINTHLPRSKDYEDPFNPSHLIDGNPETCWSSQQNSSPFPGMPPWVQIDLGRERTFGQVNLIPYWHNTSFPAGFSVLTSADGENWREIIRRDNYHLARSGPMRGDKYAQTFLLHKTIQARYIRVVFERLPLSSGTYAEVSQGYKARLSGVEVMDGKGHNFALADQGASVSASDYFTGWQDTAKTVNESFSRIFDIGLKWIRVGQWGDQTEWATVEREKGNFQIDPMTDAGIQDAWDNGVHLLWTLCYGNTLYEPHDKPYIDIGPTFKHVSPFYKDWGPRTEEGRQAFVRYVDFVVRRYGDRVKWWELWNEENGWYPGNHPVLYGKLLYAVAKHINSINYNTGDDLKVMFGGTAAPAPITTGIALRQGAAPYVDACALHPYGIPKPEGGLGTNESYHGKVLSESAQQTGWKCTEDVVEGMKKPFARHGRPDIK